jgi:hypothetical protein
MKNFATKLLLAFWLAALAPFALAAESGYASKELEIRAEPRNDARVVGKLAANARFEMVKREAAWAQITTGTQTGWVLFFFLMNGDPPASQGGGLTGAADALGFATRRQGTIVANIGIRGLDEEKLKSAQFNASELQKLESFLVPKQTALSFAQEGPLAQRRVEYVAEPTGGR